MRLNHSHKETKMRGYILASHGPFASALKESLEFITGERKDVKTIGLTHDDGPESFKAKIEVLVESMNEYDQIVVFTDLLGGSPGNAMVQLFIHDHRFHLISGMNFPMLLSAVLDSSLSPEEIVQAGRDGVVDIKAFMTQNTDFDDE